MGAALSSFFSFTCGAVIPLIPFALGAKASAVPIAAGLAGASLFVIGALLSLFSGKNALAGGARMLLIGSLAGGATYVIGTFLDVSGL